MRGMPVEVGRSTTEVADEVGREIDGGQVEGGAAGAGVPYSGWELPDGVDAETFLAEARAADAELRSSVIRENKAKSEQGATLARIALREYHRALGFSDLCDYAVSRGVSDSERKVKELAGLKAELVHLPVIRAAYEAGTLPWTKARTIAAVATAANEGAWLEKALENPNRKLEAMVRAARGLPPIERLVVEQTPEQKAWFERAALGVRQRSGRALTNADVLEILCKESLHGRHGSSDDACVEPAEGEGEGEGSAEGGAQGEVEAAGVKRVEAKSRRRVASHGRGTPSTRVVLYRCEGCERTTLEGRDGPVEVSGATYEQARCNAEVLDIRKGPGHVTKTVPPRVANHIHARDRGRCQVGDCRSVGFLHMHHEGGRGAVGHDPDRMFLACEAHHQDLHRELVKATGRWPELAFSLADGTPLPRRASGRSSREELVRERDPRSSATPALLT
jgi:hypothetical protein